MTLQASAIVDVRPAGPERTAGIPNWLRGIGVRQVRLACGLVMFTYIFSHFFNHALGNISYALMESWLSYHIWFWRIPVVNFALYAAAATHASLGLWALYQRRHFRYTVAEITQLTSGTQYSAFAVHSFRRRARRRPDVRAGSAKLCGAALRLLGRAPVYDRGPVRSPHRGLDARLHWALFLAAPEAVLQMGGAVFARHRRIAAAAGDDRRASWRAGGHSARGAAAMARRAHTSDPAAAARGRRRGYRVLLPDRLPQPDRTGVCRAWCAHPARAPPRHDHGHLPRPAGARAEGLERSRSEPAFQRAARQRVRRPGDVLHLPCPRRQRSWRAAAAVGARGVRAGARRRQCRPGDPAGVPITAECQRGHHSRPAGACRRRFCPQPSPHPYRRGAFCRQHVCRHARLHRARRGAAAFRYHLSRSIAS